MHKKLACVTERDLDEDKSNASTATQSVSPIGISPINDSLAKKNITVKKSVSRLKSGQEKRCDNLMIAPSTREEQENEKYARKIGICFSITRGDYLTLYNGCNDEDSIDTDLSAALSISPKYGKKDDGFQFRELYGNVEQIVSTPDEEGDPHLNQVIDVCPDEESTTVEIQTDLISPRTRSVMIIQNDVVETLRARAAILSKNWADKENLAPVLARRLRDFEFAQKKRRKYLGETRKFGILGMYDFLSAVRQDVDWADEAAFRRSNCLPYQRWSDYVNSTADLSNIPIFAYSILIICTISLIVSVGLNGWEFESFSRNPSFGPSQSVLLKMGAKHSGLIVNSFEVWRLVTPMFLHGGIIHFLLNCFAIFYIGRAVEQNHGILIAVILFIVPSIGSTIISAIFLPQFISVGASGGIFGLIGGCVAEIIKNRQLLFSDFINKGKSKRHHMIVVFVLVLDIFLNLLIGLTPFTDNFMHLGGFIFGFLIGSTLLNEVDIEGNGSKPSKSRTFIIFSKWFGLLVSLVCVVAAMILLFFTGNGKTSPCKSCSVISCVSFPPWANYDDRWWYCDDCEIVEAYGIRDTNTYDYISVEMECPSGSHVTFNLEEPQTDTSELSKQIPSICRNECF